MFNNAFPFLTDFGDSAVTGCLALLLAVVLLTMQERRAALAMGLVFLIVAFGIGAGKLLFYSRCADETSFLGLRSPSGHSAMSVGVYGMAAALVASSLSGKAKVWPFLLAVPFVALIALSRVKVGVHTVQDVAVGSLWGAFVCWGVWRLTLKDHAVQRPWWIPAGLALVAPLFLHGTHFPAEGIIDWLSALIRGRLLACPG